MLVIVGSKSDLIKGQIENVEIHATFLNLDFNDVDFETSLSECLQKVREEVMAHKNLLSEQKQTLKSKQKHTNGHIY